MKNTISLSIISVTIACAIFSCYPKFDEPKSSAGGLNLSRYVAIGNSITAGFSDAALYYDGQQVAYPNLLAQQFALVGGGNFKQPLVPNTSVGIGSSGNAKKILGFSKDCKDSISLAPVDAATAGDMTIFTNKIASQGPFNNMGVPGAKATHIAVQGYGAMNPFFGRMASSPAASMLSDAVAQNPGFFSLFIGNNDVLGYATSGGVTDNITPSGAFNVSIDAIIEGLTANDAKGIIGNIPDITSLPFFTTIPYNGLTLDQAKATALSTAYTGLGMQFQAGNNAFIIEDATKPGALRQIKQGELILLTLPQDSIRCGGYGSSKPIPNQYVLTEAEITAIKNATTAYNTKLEAVANAKELAFVDINAFMKSCNTGIIYNGITVNARFVTGGAFSLDGVHLTPIGNALLANEFIKAINKKYSSTISLIDASKYRGVAFPAS